MSADDLVARLRWVAGNVREQTENVDDPWILGNIHGACDALRDAADEIDRLRFEHHLGLATTRDLLDELRCRIEVDYFVGGGGLDYSTVAGRPDAILDAPEPQS